MNRQSLLTDTHFEKGFRLNGLGAPIYGDPIETFGDPYRTDAVFNYGGEALGEPDWILSQWATRYPFHDTGNTTHPGNCVFVRPGKGIFRYDNPSKQVTVVPARGELSLLLRASACYREPRRPGQEWPHLLVERSLGGFGHPPEANRLSSAQRLRVRLDVRLDSYEDRMGAAADPELHAIIFIYYLFLAHFDEREQRYDDMLWFGLPLWDNRRAYTPLQSFPDEGTKGSATGKWIYNNATTEFFGPENNLYTPEGGMVFGQWRSVDLDVLPLARRALAEAQANGYMQSSRWENLYVNGMYFGFEACGTYDAGVSVQNLDLIREEA